jgi:2-methylisocitrate lyase-like PEP mutase family enzyme
MDARTTFRKLHDGHFVLPNPWDQGSAKILAAMGFPALATTSAGFANSLGRIDGGVTREEAIAHARTIAQTTGLPVNGDLENGFGDDPKDAAETVSAALEAGLAGCSIEDFGGATIYDRELAIDRITAAVEANRASDAPLVLTARAENFIRGNPDLDDTIARLQAYQEAGADVLYAPGPSKIEDIRTILASIDRPLNVLLRPDGPSTHELFQAGVTRVSTGSAISLAVQSVIVEAARELQGPGTAEFVAHALPNAGFIRKAISGRD